ncbi:hypothetical protein K4H28_15215 [Deefgea tanakiae]|uniref:Uncharacterized protein n=1 Tax=Deefgea tanakiae TaxID=2865840 RepID=A0ABX8Z4V1_9NEIS|nr:hypothetical protein [Deefgea tanakiae]QZA77604.1 hypothetical protein K4H28_15215 [Deefgea tanakiae]
MSPITSSSVSNVPVTPPTSATNTTVGAAELQKQLQQQRQEVRETVKPVAEQVFISKQAQQQFDTYAASAANAADRYDEDSSSSNSNTGVSTDQALDTLKTVQNRQTAAALAEYAQQQAQANPRPQPEPRAEAEQKPTTSIKAIA